MRRKKKPDNMTPWEYRKMKLERNMELLEKKQRIITIARRRRGLTLTQLADLIYVSKATLQQYESGRYPAQWDLLDKVMPELQEMRKHDCSAYCKVPHTCIETGKCVYRCKGLPPRDL